MSGRWSGMRGSAIQEGVAERDDRLLEQYLTVG